MGLGGGAVHAPPQLVGSPQEGSLLADVIGANHKQGGCGTGWWGAAQGRYMHVSRADVVGADHKQGCCGTVQAGGGAVQGAAHAREHCVLCGRAAAAAAAAAAATDDARQVTGWTPSDSQQPEATRPPTWLRRRFPRHCSRHGRHRLGLRREAPAGLAVGCVEHEGVDLLPRQRGVRRHAGVPPQVTGVQDGLQG